MRLLLLIGTLDLLAACHSPNLEAVRPERVAMDDLLQINATICTEPAADAQFPVKVVFIVDTSRSMVVTDGAAVRATAVTQVLQRFAGNPAVQFAVISFNAEVTQI